MCDITLPTARSEVLMHEQVIGLVDSSLDCAVGNHPCSVRKYNEELDRRSCDVHEEASCHSGQFKDGERRDLAIVSEVIKCFDGISQQ